MSASPRHPYLSYFGEPLNPGKPSTRHTPSTSTRKPSPYDKHIAEVHQLKKLSFAPGMADRFIATLDKHLKTLPSRTEEEQHQFMTQCLKVQPVDAFHREDSITVAMGSHVVKPSIILALLALQEGYWPIPDNPPSLPIQPLRAGEAAPPFPWAEWCTTTGCAECPEAHVNPDTWQGEKCKDASLAAEYKVIRELLEQRETRRAIPEKAPPLTENQRKSARWRKDLALSKGKWGEVCKRLESARRILIQSYAHMVRHDVTFGVISSYRFSLFTARDRDSQTLYVSLPIAFNGKPPSVRQAMAGSIFVSFLDRAWREATEGWRDWDDPGKNVRSKKTPSAGGKGGSSAGGACGGKGGDGGGDGKGSKAGRKNKDGGGSGRGTKEIKTGQGSRGGQDSANLCDDALYQLHMGFPN
ncbi:hypothetical protein BOTBODRAFT_49634, partial [Botryobasidium botryosum FD-172 SS1]